MYLFQRIEEVMMQYQDARQVIAEFILKEKDRLFTYSMEEIADRTFTSKPTLVRFAKALGYKGWKDFMKAFVEEVKYQETNSGLVDVNFPFNENSSYKDIIHNVSKLQMESIRDTVEKLDAKTLEMAVSRILQSNRIVVFAANPNTYLANTLRWKFLSIGKNIEIASSGELGLISSTLTKNDCAIFISYSGNQGHKEPMSHIENLKKQCVKFIGVTSGGNNYIRENIDCVLTVSSRERLYSKVANFSTEQSMLTIFDILFACYFKRDYSENIQYKVNNARKLEVERKASEVAMEEKF